MTAESPFDTRYFTVSIAGGQVTDVNTARIAAVGAKRAASIAAKLHSKGWVSVFLAIIAIRLTFKTMRPPMCSWTARASLQAFIRF